MNLTKISILSILLFSSSISIAWDGYNYTTGEYFSITEYDHQYMGEGNVVYCDLGYRNCRTGYLDLYPDLTGTLVDDETGEEYDIEMEDN
ncbi:hypothetical protein A1D22_05260 [Pasteurellaceae bacterium LFhippo2]|nr:hypothetical protein [Pasteurellaceae bacterium LFhippo2]